MEDDAANLRTRLHKLNDVVIANQGRIAEQGVVIQMLQRQIEIMQGTGVDRDLLNATMGTALSKIEMIHNENKLKFDHVDTKLDSLGSAFDNKLGRLDDALQPIRRAIWWAASLIVGAVILALLALVIQQGGPGVP